MQLSGTDAMWVAEEVRGKGEAIRWQVVFKPSAAKMTEALLAGANRSLGPDLHFKPKGFVLEDAVPEGRVQGILVGDPDTLKSVYEEIAADPVAFLPEEIEAAKQVWEDAVARKKAKDAAPKPKPKPTAAAKPKRRKNPGPLDAVMTTSASDSASDLPPMTEEMV